ncbi:kinase-like domain-containing protein [Obelidium mucronatum]|nr:kinase-like domain-containing protein [Obelidium mucronatum]
MIERAIKKEMENWKKLSALPNVHTLIGVTPAYPPKLIAEFCPNQVDGYIMSHPEQLFRVLYELISGLQDIHNHNVIHRDLSPRNVLITCEGVVAISDFGMSRKNAAEASNSLNAPHLRRPEINFQSPDSFVNRNASSEIDIWSFGMLAYYLVTGTEPYAGKSYEETSDLIQAGVLPLRPEGREYIEITNRFGVELEPLFLMIRGCWLRDPLRRFDSKVIKSILESSYRNEIGVAPARA